MCVFSAMKEGLLFLNSRCEKPVQHTKKTTSEDQVSSKSRAEENKYLAGASNSPADSWLELNGLICPGRKEPTWTRYS